MVTTNELEQMIVEVLNQSLDRIHLMPPSQYYNKYFGDLSVYIITLLEIQLTSKYPELDKNKYLDDALLTKVIFQGKKVMIWGIVIWGMANTTTQWTDPIYFEINLMPGFKDFTELTILFVDLNSSELVYEQFEANSNYWDKDFFTTDDWLPGERNWKYIINRKK